MDIDVRPKGSGKTTDLIKKAHVSGGYIITTTTREAQRIHAMSRSMGLKINLPVSVEEARSVGFRFVSKKQPIMVDQADAVLSILLGYEPIAITMTKEEL